MGLFKSASHELANYISVSLKKLTIEQRCRLGSLWTKSSWAVIAIAMAI
jgi:hypothetical protein